MESGESESGAFLMDFDDSAEDWLSSLLDDPDFDTKFDFSGDCDLVLPPETNGSVFSAPSSFDILENGMSSEDPACSPQPIPFSTSELGFSCDPCMYDATSPVIGEKQGSPISVLTQASKDSNDSGSHEGSVGYNKNSADNSGSEGETYTSKLHPRFQALDAEQGNVRVHTEGDPALQNAEGSRKKMKTCKRKREEPFVEVGHEDEDVKDNIGVDEEEHKRQARLIRNRESAQLSRQRKKSYIGELENQLKALKTTVAELNNTVRLISAENMSLRSQLAMMYQPFPNTATPTPMAYPVAPHLRYPAYMGVMPNSSLPPVPIPKLKTNKVDMKSNEKKTSASRERKDNRKVKRLASVAAMGFLCILMLLLPTDHGFGNPRTTWGGKLPSISRTGGRVLMSYDTSSLDTGSATERPFLDPEMKLDSGPDNEKCCANCAELWKSDSFLRNFTEPVAATLFVPRNDKLVRVDGSLVVQSIIAADLAMNNTDDVDEIRLLASTYPPALTKSQIVNAITPYLGRTSNYLESKNSMDGDVSFTSPKISQDVKALPSAQVHVAEDFPTEDFSGTLLNTGTCVEVFRFETDKQPASTSISTYDYKLSKDMDRQPPRLMLRGLPAGSYPEHTTNNGSSGDQQSSLVVSLLAPPEAPSGEGKLSRIFVVVLLNGVKYVTYSCMVPPIKMHSPVVTR